MKQSVKELITLLYSGNIDKKEFLQNYFDNKSPDNKLVSELFAKGIVNEDADIIEEVIVLLYTGIFPNSTCTNYLSELLLVSWHTKHEDIASLLKNIASPNTVENLHKAVELKLDYLEYDDTFQLARKCIKALSRINNEQAIDKLKLLSNSENEVISKYAEKELVQKGLL